jgi:hypothetical protein
MGRRKREQRDISYVKYDFRIDKISHAKLAEIMEKVDTAAKLKNVTTPPRSHLLNYIIETAPDLDCAAFYRFYAKKKKEILSQSDKKYFFVISLNILDPNYQRFTSDIEKLEVYEILENMNNPSKNYLLLYYIDSFPAAHVKHFLKKIKYND